MNRRNLILGAGAALATATLARAQTADPAHAGHTARASTLIDASAACLAAGEVCMQHCLTLLAKGDVSIADCSQRVHEMLGTMNAVLRLAGSGSKRLAALVAVAKDVCGDCEAECRKHQEKHAACRACAEACARTIQAMSA